MMNSKMTYVNAINFALRAINGEKLDNAVEVADKLIALGQQLEKRNSTKSNKPTKAQRENADLKDQIVDYLTEQGGQYRAGEIAMSFGISGQKASALLNQLVKDGKVAKVDGEKRTTLFTLADADDPVQALPGEITM